VDLTDVSTATLKYWTWYDIEADWDYAYLLVSTDNGIHWSLVPPHPAARRIQMNKTSVTDSLEKVAVDRKLNGSKRLQT